MTLYVGIMSGTSLDGIDVALININNDVNTDTNITLIGAHTTPFSSSLSTALNTLMQPEARHSLAEIGSIQQSLAKAYAGSVNDLLEQQRLSPTDISAIGCHGQTVWHAPDTELPFSWQLNNAALLAALTGIDVIDNFRANDLAQGGQGAPLVPPFHQALFMPYPTTINQRILINIGGIANITVLPAAPSEYVIGFDTGPGNTLLDLWCAKHTGQSIDQDGAWGNAGKSNATLLAIFLADPYFALPAPKSTGREYFNLSWLEQKLDTYFTHITAQGDGSTAGCDVSSASCDDPTASSATPSTHSTSSRLAAPSPQDIQATLVTLTSISIAQAIANTVQNTETTTHSPQQKEWLICGGGIHNKPLQQQLQHQAIQQHAILTNMDTIGYDGDAIEAMAFAWLAYCYDKQICANSPAVTGAYKSVILGAKTYA